MDRETLIALALIALAFFFILPSWSPVSSHIKIEKASLINDSVSFTIDYAAPFPKSCFIVVYGPFAYDKPGHEEGNNIYVLSNRVGKIEDILVLQKGKSIKKLKAELWCDWKKLGESNFTLG